LLNALERVTTVSLELTCPSESEQYLQKSILNLRSPELRIICNFIIFIASDLKIC
jgi:hypothetical protein